MGNLRQNGVLQGSILAPTFFLLYINDFPKDFMRKIASYADDATLYSNCEQSSDLWQQLWVGFYTRIWPMRHCRLGQEVACWFIAGKIQLVLFDRSNDFGAIDAKMDGSVLEEKSSLKMLGLSFSSKLDWGPYKISVDKPLPKIIGVLMCSTKFLSLEITLLLYKSSVRPGKEYCCHVWASAAKCHVNATCIC